MKREIKRPTVLIESGGQYFLWKDIATEYDILSPSREKIGSFTITSTYKKSHQKPTNSKPLFSQISAMKLKYNLKDKGFGKSTYLKILELLGDSILISGTVLSGRKNLPEDQSNGSYQIWLSLVRDGLATKITTKHLDKQGNSERFMSLPGPLKKKSTNELRAIFDAIQEIER